MNLDIRMPVVVSLLVAAIALLAALSCSQPAFADVAPPVQADPPNHCVARDRMNSYYTVVGGDPDHYQIRGLASRYDGSTIAAARTAASAMLGSTTWDDAERLYIRNPTHQPIQILIVPTLNHVASPDGTTVGGIATFFCDDPSNSVVLIPRSQTERPLPIIENTIAHELGHVFQSGELNIFQRATWWGEATAELGGFTTSRVTTRLAWLDQFFFENPGLSLDRHRSGDAHEYAAFRITLGAERLRAINHEVFRLRLHDNADATNQLRTAFAATGRSTFADALGQFWIQHANGEPADNGRRVEGTTLSFGSDATHYWHLFPNRLAAVVGRIRLNPGVRTVRISYESPGLRDSRRMWGLDRGHYLDWTGGGSVTYRVDGNNGPTSVGNCPDGSPRATDETKPWPGQFPFAFSNAGEVPIVGRVQIVTSTTDDFTTAECPQSSSIGHHADPAEDPAEASANVQERAREEGRIRDVERERAREEERERTREQERERAREEEAARERAQARNRAARARAARDRVDRRQRREICLIRRLARRQPAQHGAAKLQRKPRAQNGCHRRQELPQRRRNRYPQPPGHHLFGASRAARERPPAAHAGLPPIPRIQPHRPAPGPPGRGRGRGRLPARQQPDWVIG